MKKPYTLPYSKTCPPFKGILKNGGHMVDKTHFLWFVHHAETLEKPMKSVFSAALFILFTRTAWSENTTI